MARSENSINGTLVAVLAAVGLPMAAISLGAAVVALNVSSNSRQAVDTVVQSAERAQTDVTQEMAATMLSQVLADSEAALEVKAQEAFNALQANLQQVIDKQTNRIVALEAALADAKGTIAAASIAATTPDSSTGAYNADAYQQLSGIGIDWIETKGTDFVVEAVERDVPAVSRVAVEQSPSTDPSANAVIGDAAAGKRKFAQCASCHTVNEGGRSGIGPNLWGVYEAEVAVRDGYKFSNALKNHGGTWSQEQLDAFLANPRRHVQGTKMAYSGMRNETDRANIIAYLATLQ